MCFILPAVEFSVETDERAMTLPDNVRCKAADFPANRAIGRDDRRPRRRDLHVPEGLTSRGRLPAEPGESWLSLRAAPQKSTVTLSRANRGLSTVVGASHVAPLVTGSYVWLKAVPVLELNRL